MYILYYTAYTSLCNKNCVVLLLLYCMRYMMCINEKYNLCVVQMRQYSSERSLA